MARIYQNERGRCTLFAKGAIVRSVPPPQAGLGRDPPQLFRERYKGPCLFLTERRIRSSGIDAGYSSAPRRLLQRFQHP